MSRCHQTDALLDSIFAGTDITRAQADHAAGCSECARALAHARRFDGELHRIGLDLSPEAVSSAALAAPSLIRGGRSMTWRRGVFGAAGAAVLLMAVVYGGGQWLGNVFGDRTTSAPAAPSITAGAAAALVGVPPNEVLMTEDGALVIKDLGLSMDLVLVRSTSDGAEQLVLDSTPPGVGPTLFSAVTCAEDDLLVRTDYVWGRWEEISQVAGPGEYVIGASNHLIFAYDPAGSEPAAPLVVFEGENGSSNFGPAGSLGERPCLGHVADPAARPQMPLEMRCVDWPDLTDVEQIAVTEALIDDRLLPAVRERQQLPLSAGIDELIEAASWSIDKWCQDPRFIGDALSEVIARGYGSAD